MADAGLIRICDSAALTDGGDGVRFTLTDGSLEREAFAVRFRGQVVAYLNRCSHTGLELDWIAGRFFDPERRWLICAAHGALYEPGTGGCAAGPCNGPLVPVPVVEIDGAVYRRPGAASSR